MTDAPYLLAGQQVELERLQLQSRVWEPFGERLLARLPRRGAVRALDVGCGVMGWLRALARWAGSEGVVVGTDFDDKMLQGAQRFVDSEGLGNVSLQRDDLFDSRLTAGSFDLVHARFEIAPLGRAAEQVAIYHRLLRPGGVLVLEEPDGCSWRVNPDGAAVHELMRLICDGFAAAGGDFNAGRELPSLLRSLGLRPSVESHVLALASDHPYLRLPLQFANALRPRLRALVDEQTLDALITRAEAELARPDIWGTTFTLIQAWATLPD
jgi:SAM-dependent methyltransferase